MTRIEGPTAATTEVGEPSSATTLAENEAKNPASTRAEAGRYSEAESIEEQARRVGPLNQEENLLRDPEKRARPEKWRYGPRMPTIFGRHSAAAVAHRPAG